MKTPAPTRDRIITAATMLFWMNGYHAVSTDMICKEASVSKSSLYNAFSSKEKILSVCLATIWERNWAEIQAIYTESDDPIAALKNHILWFSRSQKRIVQQYGRVLGSFDMAVGVSIPDEVKASMKSHQQAHFDLLKTSVSSVINIDGSSPTTLWCANLVGDMIVSNNYRARMDNNIGPLDNLADNVFGLIELIKAW